MKPPLLSSSQSWGGSSVLPNLFSMSDPSHLPLLGMFLSQPLWDSIYPSFILKLATQSPSRISPSKEPTPHHVLYPLPVLFAFIALITIYIYINLFIRFMRTNFCLSYSSLLPQYLVQCLAHGRYEEIFISNCWINKGDRHRSLHTGFGTITSNQLCG